MEQAYPLFVFFFWFGLFIVFYTYIGYGILLYILVRIKETVKKKTIRSFPASLPDVTLFITAYNEEDIVRQKMEKNIKPVADELRRRAMITATHETADNACRVHLALSDGVGEILNLQMLCAGEEQAEKLEKNFRKNAERYYTQIMELLSRDEKL